MSRRRGKQLFSIDRLAELLGLRDQSDRTTRDQRQFHKLLDRINQFEAPLVKWVAAKAQRPFLSRTSRVVNQLGNGWLYLVTAISTIALRGTGAIRLELLSLGSVILAYTLYFPLKRNIARRRPYDWDPSLPSTTRALDIYSCPSGHCMNLCAVGTVFSWSFPELLPLVGCALLLMGWTRLAMAHHYPSDLIAGMALGTSVALTLCMVLL
jgi:undecaprenyl-diphosphatase